jgi:hypothetical protein
MKTSPESIQRFLMGQPPARLTRPPARVQPIQAAAGHASVDVAKLREVVRGVAVVEPVIVVQSPEHWAQVVRGLGPEVDCILPIGVPAYPTEIWNSHPQPLVERGLPLVFWSLLAHEEPDIWRWSATDFLRALGVTVHPVRNNAHGLALLKALAMRRFLRGARMVVFGEQNFPWNAPAAGHLFRESLGLEIVVRSIADFRARAAAVSEKEVEATWNARQARYRVGRVRPEGLREAIRTYLGIRAVLGEERAIGFGVNCFGDLVIQGGRDVPCLAQLFAREDGCIASCDADYVCMATLALLTYFTDRPCLMSNLYPVQYVGALEDHFGDPLSPDPKKYPRRDWKNYARLGHCGFVGVVPPEMSPDGAVTLHDWGGTYEIQRDGRGCGIDGGLFRRAPVTVAEMKFDGRTWLLARAELVETTRHRDMPHCESTALLRFDDLPAFVENISRDHATVVYGDHLGALQVLGDVLGLKTLVV